MSDMIASPKPIPDTRDMDAAAVARDKARACEFKHVADIVLGPESTRPASTHVTDVMFAGGGYLVCVTREFSGREVTFTTVYDNLPSNVHFKTWQEALLHLVARSTGHDRHDPTAVHFAWRTLNPLADRVVE